MERELALRHRAQVEEFQRKHRIGLLTLLFSDIVGSMALKQKWGDRKPVDLYGMQVDACARIMSLAVQNQILMSRFAFDNARQVLRGQDLEGIQVLFPCRSGAVVEA